MQKVGIISLCYRSWNFGGALQGYALCRALDKFHVSGEQMVFNQMPPVETGETWKKRLWLMLHSFPGTKKVIDLYHERTRAQDPTMKNHKRFSRRVPHSRYLGTPKALRESAKEYDAFIVGSDQVWNPQYFGDELLRRVFGLQFAQPSKRKLSYAASIGSEQAAVGKEDLFREMLAGLDFISVRERAARDFLQPLTDKPVAVVLDPTLLLSREEWEKIAAGPGREPPHLFAYFLHERDNRHDEQLHQIAGALDLTLRCIADERERYLRPETEDKQILDAGPQEFLGEIRDAEMVFTNSFHGVVFSVLFHKPFWVFKRNRDGDKGSMNARVTDFLSDFGLSDRLLEDGEAPSLEKLRTPIDYDAVDRVLEEKRAFSLNWLKTALEGV